MSSTVTVRQRGNVLVATLDNPPHALMDARMVAELAQLAERADRDATVGGVVLTGGHPSRFLAHFDVREILRGAESSPRLAPGVVNAAMRTVGAALRLPGAGSVLERSPAAGLVAMERMRDVMLSIGRCAAVWVAALNGDTGGGGCELALACDMRVMAAGDHAISQPEVFLGFPPGAGGTQRLARLLGTGRALRVCLDGGPIRPGEAYELGIVDRVVAPEELLEVAVAEAARLGRRPKTAIGAIKRAINDGGSLPLVDGLRLEAAEFVSAMTTPGSIAAQRAYVRRTEELGDLPAGIPEEVEKIVERGRFA